MAESSPIVVRPHQVRAARLALRLAKNLGRQPDPTVVRIANARRLETNGSRDDAT